MKGSWACPEKGAHTNTISIKKRIQLHAFVVENTMCSALTNRDAYLVHQNCECSRFSCEAIVSSTSNVNNGSWEVEVEKTDRENGISFWPWNARLCRSALWPMKIYMNSSKRDGCYSIISKFVDCPDLHQWHCQFSALSKRPYIPSEPVFNYHEILELL